MMDINPRNPMFERVVRNAIVDTSYNERQMIGDFNEFKLTVVSDHKAKLLMVGVQCYGFEEVWKHGGQKLITQYFGEFIATEECKDLFSPSIQLVLRFPIKDLPKYPKLGKEPSEEERKAFNGQYEEVKRVREEFAETITAKIYQLKTLFYGAPMEYALRELKEKGKIESPADYVCQIPYRRDQKFWVVPEKDKVSVIYGVHFVNPQDMAIGNVIFAELMQSTRQVKNSPSISLYPREVPLPIKGFGVKVDDYSNGFINLVVYENHLKKGYDKALQYLVDFRQYVHYHIHAIKAFLHVRMRNKINKLSDSLTEAYIVGTEGKKYKQKIGGDYYPEEEKKEEPKEIFKVK